MHVSKVLGLDTLNPLLKMKTILPATKFALWHICTFRLVDATNSFVAIQVCGRENSSHQKPVGRILPTTNPYRYKYGLRMDVETSRIVIRSRDRTGMHTSSSLNMPACSRFAIN